MLEIEKYAGTGEVRCSAKEHNGWRKNPGCLRQAFEFLLFLLYFFPKHPGDKKTQSSLLSFSKLTISFVL